MKECIIQQNMTEISNRSPKEFICASDFLIKPNNWLKLHGMTMRRKPHKKRVAILDEFWMISGPNEPSPLIKATLPMARKYQIDSLLDYGSNDCSHS